MSCPSPQDLAIYRGQTVRLALVVANAAGERYDLTGAALDLHVKTAVTEADPPVLTVSTGSGVVIRTQTGTDIGVADAEITAAQTALLTGRDYVYDVWLTPAVGDLLPVVPVSKLTVLTPVSTP